MTQLCSLRFATVAAGVALNMALFTASASADRSYYIDEWVNFPDPGQACSQGDLNTVTASLRNAMVSDGWSGVRYVDGSAWPQDFWDQNRDSGGLDHFYGDTKTVTIYAGHGSPGTIYFGPHNNACTASTMDNMRLGAVPGSGGAKAALAVWLACQVPNVDLLGGETSINNIRQQLAWLNNISIGDDEPRDVYNKTKTQLNKDAWLWTMNGWGRQPIVVSQTTLNTADACWWYHDHQSWGQDVQHLMYGYAGYRCWEWIE